MYIQEDLGTYYSLASGVRNSISLMEMGQTRSRRDQQRRHKNEKLSMKKHKVAARRKVKFQLQKHTLPKCVMRIGLDTQSSILTHTHTFTLYNYPGHHSGEGTMSAATFLIQMRPGTTDASLLPPCHSPPTLPSASQPYNTKRWPQCRGNS